LTNQIECMECPAGKFSSALGSVECKPCADGSVSTAGSSRCTDCWGNNEYAYLGNTQCLPCEENMDCSSPIPRPDNNFFVVVMEESLKVTACASDMCFEVIFCVVSVIIEAC
jgi:hypothetical protein